MAQVFGQTTNMSTEETPRTERPVVTEKNREEARRVMSSYDDSRQTAVLPGSRGTVTGTAVNDWLDDEGHPLYGEPEGGQ